MGHSARESFTIAFEKHSQLSHNSFKTRNSKSFYIEVLQMFIAVYQHGTCTLTNRNTPVPS